MGKKYCEVEKKWCKLLQKGICKCANTEIENVDKCPRIAEIETTTLKTLLREVKFDDVFKMLCKYYPDQKYSRNGYESVFNKLLKKKPKKHRLDDLFIRVEHINDENGEWLDVDGVNLKKPDIAYGIEFLKWSDWVTMFITKETLRSLSKEDIVAGCLYEMTFYGFTEEHVMSEKKRLEEGIEGAKKAYDESKNK